MMRGIVRTRLTCFIVLLAGALLVPACNTPVKKPRPAPVLVAPAVPLKPLDPLFEDVEKRTFNFFWETTEGATGLVPDRWPAAPFASVAAVGFALNAYAVGVERGYVTRAQARARVLTTLRFLHAAPQAMIWRSRFELMGADGSQPAQVDKRGVSAIRRGHAWPFRYPCGHASRRRCGGRPAPR